MLVRDNYATSLGIYLIGQAPGGPALIGTRSLSSRQVRALIQRRDCGAVPGSAASARRISAESE
jgi:hypothetical protein